MGQGEPWTKPAQRKQPGRKQGLQGVAREGGGKTRRQWPAARSAGRGRQGVGRF